MHAVKMPLEQVGTYVVRLHVGGHPPQSPGQVADVSPQSQTPLPHELVKLPLTQIVPAGSPQLPFGTQLNPATQDPVAQGPQMQ